MAVITENIEQVIAHLRQGGIAAIPTETVYGLAANAENEQAIRKIYALKNRPLNHPLIMHIHKDWDLHRWVQNVPDYAQALIKAFWPGPLTLVLQLKPEQTSTMITGGQTTLAIRCPKHPITEMLLKTLDFPLVAPSANPFGKISPTTAEHVKQSFLDNTLLILDGGRCSIGIESTIVSATSPDGYQILRHGIITESMIAEVLPKRQLFENNTTRVPGRLAQHYQPEKTLYLINNNQNIQKFVHQIKKTAYILSFQPHADYELPSCPDRMAYELYFQLRKADESAAKILVLELPPARPEWEGIRERLLKAGILQTSC